MITKPLQIAHRIDLTAFKTDLKFCKKHPKHAQPFLLFLLASLFVLLSMASPIVRGENTNSEDCHLKIALAEWGPYQYFEQGVAKGIQTELVQKIAAKAGCTLAITELRFYPALQAIEKGEIDMTLNASITEERKRFAHFSLPYRNEMLALYTTEEFHQKCSQQNLVNLIDSGFRLALQTDMVYGEVVKQIQKDPKRNAKIIYFEHSGDDAAFLRNNNVDGLIEDPVTVAYKQRKTDKGEKLLVCKNSYSSSPVSFIFSKKTVSPKIVKKFNDAIIAIQKSEYYKKTWYF